MNTNVLIVDDNSDNLYLLKILMEKQGWNVHEALNGSVALKIAQDHMPDLIVSDILMPVMDGYPLCQHCKADQKLKNIPFVFYTATYTEPKDEKFALALGADRFIIKPEEPSTLINILIELLEEKNTENFVAARPLGEEMEFFRRYNEILFHKLEKKILDLEMANQEFKELEERYRLNFENITDVIFSFDTNLNILSMSPSVEKILGYKAQDFIGCPLSEIGSILSPQSLEKAINHLDQIFKGSILPPSIYEFIGKDGTLTVGEVSGSPFIRNGKVAGIVCVGRNITRRKKAEDALRESEERFRILTESSPTAILLFQNDRWIYANPAATAITGYPNQELLSMNFWDVVHPDDRQSVMERGQKRQQGMPVTRRYEFRILSKDKTVKWVDLSGETIVYNGNPAGIISVLEITERKKMEEELKQAEENFRRSLEDSPLGALIIVETGKMMYANRALLDIYGCKSLEELEAIPAKDRYTPESFAEHEDRKAKRKKDRYVPSEYEVSIVRRDGDIRHLRVFRKEVLWSGNRLFQVLYNDITERKLAEEYQKSMQERLQRAEKMEVLGRMAGKVAHDLNNVLGALTGYSELLLMQLPEGQRARTNAEKIMQSTQKGAAIIQDLLTMARRGVTATEIINLNSVIAGFFKTPVFEGMKEQYPRVVIRTNCDPDLMNIKASPVHMEKMLMNLLSNAVEAVPDAGEVSIRTENRYLDRDIRGYERIEEGDYVVLTVSDTGTGIEAENLDKIFEPFYTNKGMGRSGTGLGLSIVWGTVKDHDGYIEVQSNVGKGTTFTLYFPVTREGMTLPRQKTPLERYRGRGESVLVVDDIAEQRDVASGLLAQMGYQVHTASGGEEAVEYLRENRADLLVLDMIMAPGIDGLETYQRILQIHPKQKAILVSGFSETDRVREAQRLGAGAYIKKPYTMETIGMAIRDELNR
ncbi:MAG: PAS domain S-box protein [Smithellaceae bacterium]|nr:PAS domain S-box protein [Smithellaceae bacterium]